MKSRTLSVVSIMSLSASLGLVACSAKLESGAVPPPEVFGGGSSGAQGAEDSPVPGATVLEGTWSTACAQQEYSRRYVIWTYKFNQTQYSLEGAWYTDSSCQVESQSLMPSPIHGQFKIGADLADGAHELDLEESDNITKHYTVFKLKDGKLLLGKRDGSKPEWRGTELDTSSPLEKNRPAPTPAPIQPSILYDSVVDPDLAGYWDSGYNSSITPENPQIRINIAAGTGNSVSAGWLESTLTDYGCDRDLSVSSSKSAKKLKFHSGDPTKPGLLCSYQVTRGSSGRTLSMDCAYERLSNPDSFCKARKGMSLTAQ